MKIVYFLGPLAIILASALQFAGDNVEYTQAETLNLLLISLACGYAIIWLGLRLCLGSDTASRITFWLAVLWLIYPLTIYMPLRYFLDFKGIAFSTWLGIPLILSILISYKKLPYNLKLHSALFLIGVSSSIIALPSVSDIYSSIPMPKNYHDVEDSVATRAPVITPHVLYIVPDRYPSNTLLQEAFSHDNAAFAKELEDRGFYVWRDQFSNYGKTFLSLASTLNMNYLDDTFTALSGIRSYLPVIQLMRDNQFLRILKAHGYQYTHLGGWWQPTKASPFADSTLFADGMDEFIDTYLLTTPLGYFSSKLDNQRSACKKLTLQSNFISEATQKQKAQFIFWHMFSVHPPYIFDKKGDCFSYPISEGTWDMEKQSIINQIGPTNQQLLKLIARIQKKSARPVIIIIQADEGPIHYILRTVGTDYLTLPTNVKRLKFGIMNAVYLPSGNYEDFAEQQSPVNNFRLVLREIFQTPLPLLPHRHYSFQYESMPYDMYDISAELHSAERPR